MRNPRGVLRPDVNPVIRLLEVLMLLSATLLGAAAAMVLIPFALPMLASSLRGPEPKIFWYLARSSAWIAYFLLWISMMMGLGITSKLARIWPGGPAACDLHKFISLLSIAVALFHGLILIGDRYMSFSVAQVFIPFSNSLYRPIWVGLGQIGFYTLAVLGLSFYVRRLITPRVWRIFHYLSFLTYLLVLIHGITSGSDSAQPWAVWSYFWTGGMVAAMILFRIFFSGLSVVRAASLPDRG